MSKRIDDQERFINFVMTGDLTAVETTLKTASTIFTNRKKLAGTIGASAAPLAAIAPKTRKRRNGSTETAAAAPVVEAAAEIPAAPPAQEASMVGKEVEF